MNTLPMPNAPSTPRNQRIPAPRAGTMSSPKRITKVPDATAAHQQPSGVAETHRSPTCAETVRTGRDAFNSRINTREANGGLRPGEHQDAEGDRHHGAPRHGVPHGLGWCAHCVRGHLHPSVKLHRSSPSHQMAPVGRRARSPLGEGQQRVWLSTTGKLALGVRGTSCLDAAMHAGPMVSRPGYLREITSLLMRISNLWSSVRMFR